MSETNPKIGEEIGLGDLLLYVGGVMLFLAGIAVLFNRISPQQRELFNGLVTIAVVTVLSGVAIRRLWEES